MHAPAQAAFLHHLLQPHAGRPGGLEGRGIPAGAGDFARLRRAGPIMWEKMCK